MPDFVSLTCSSCGGKLQIPANVEQFACGYCGTEFTVNRGGGIVSLAPVVEGLKHVQRGVDKTESELAIARLQSEADALTGRRRDVQARSYLGFSGWGTFLLVVGLLTLGGQP